MNKQAHFPHLDYLTEVESSASLNFAKENNSLTEQRLFADPRYQNTHDEILAIASDSRNLPTISIINNEIYNFWQDQIHIRGILRKADIDRLILANQIGKPF